MSVKTPANIDPKSAPAKGDPAKGDPASLPNESLEKLNKSLEGLGGLLGNLDNRLTGLEQAIAASKAGPDPKDDDDDGDVNPEELDGLTNSKLLGVIEKRVGKILGGLDKKIEDTGAQQMKARIESEITELSGKHPDFWEWKKEMGDLVKINPFLTPSQAYTLARSGDSKKVEELEKKYSKKEEGDEDDKSQEPFGGLLPTSGKHNRKSHQLNAKDAAEAAWNETMGRFNIH